MRTRAFPVALSAVLLLSLAPASWAHDHKPPRSVLFVQKADQKGILGTYCWIAPGEKPDTYTQQCIDAIPTWPRAVKADPGKRTRVRYYSATEPEDLTIAYWTHVDGNGNPTGDATTFETKLEPFRNDAGEIVAWDLVFRLPASGRHLYIHAAGYWQDQDGTGDQQDASWTNHVKLR